MMKNTNQNNRKHEPLHRKICVLIFPETHEVYVDRTVAKDFWRYYDRHYRERNRITASAFRHHKEHNVLPEFFVLEEILGTDSQAFSRCIAWSKYFSDAGYEPLGTKMSSFIATMDEGTEALYQSFRNIPIQEICSNDANLFPNFKKCGSTKHAKETKSKTSKHRVALFLTDSEHQEIKNRAEKYGVSMSEYILDCVRLGGVFQIDAMFLEEYIHKIDQLQHTFNGLLATYLHSGEYYPADIITMEKIADQICQSNTTIAREFIRLTKQLRSLKKGQTLTKDMLE